MNLIGALVLGLAFAQGLKLPAKMIYDAVLYPTIQNTLYVVWGSRRT